MEDEEFVRSLEGLSSRFVGSSEVWLTDRHAYELKGFTLASGSGDYFHLELSGHYPYQDDC